MERQIRGIPASPGIVVGALVLTRLHGRVEGRRLALVALAAFVLYSLAR